jgi:DNA polymerase-3 subunit delta
LTRRRRRSISLYVTPEQAIREAQGGELRPMYLLVGEERLLLDRALRALATAAMAGGIAGFNDDKFAAGEANIDSILGAARMLPMMAKRRLVLVRGLDRWESRAARADADADDEPAAAEPKTGIKDVGPLDRLAEYAKDPVPSTVMLLVATKLHGQRRLMTAAKKGGFLVSCDPIPRRDLAAWIEGAVRERGHSIAGEVADLLAEVAGPELAYIDDCLERLSLYVGKGAPITEEAVATLVTRVRQSSIWELIDALGRRRLDRALAVLADAYDTRSGGLPQLGAIAWSVRQLLKFDSAMRTGLSPGEAATRAGAPPFRGNELAGVVRTVGRANLERWVILLSEADMALKSSRRPAQSVLEATVVEMCR